MAAPPSTPFVFMLSQNGRAKANPLNKRGKWLTNSLDCGLDATLGSSADWFDFWQLERHINAKMAKLSFSLLGDAAMRGGRKTWKNHTSMVCGGAF
jgi:hypothetical protein